MKMRVVRMGIICFFAAASAFGIEDDPLLKEKLKTFMAKNTGDFISLNDFMGFVDENSVTEIEEREFTELGGGNVSYIRVILKVGNHNYQMSYNTNFRVWSTMRVL